MYVINDANRARLHTVVKQIYAVQYTYIFIP